MPTITLPRYVMSERSYTIYDRPDDKLPIRRLQKEGPEVLEVNELLQIALGRVDGFEELVREYGISFLTNLHTVPEIVKALKLDHLRATQLLAILGVGKRLFSPSYGSMITIRGAEDVYAHMRSMAFLPSEQLRILLLNSRYQLIHEQTLATGHVERLNVPVYEVLQPAVERRVFAFVLVHNHPSGDPTPSESDYAFSKQVQQACEIMHLQLLDHVIIAETGYSSCIESLDSHSKT